MGSLPTCYFLAFTRSSHVGQVVPSSGDMTCVSKRPDAFWPNIENGDTYLVIASDKTACAGGSHVQSYRLCSYTTRLPALSGSTCRYLHVRHDCVVGISNILMDWLEHLPGRQFWLRAAIFARRDKTATGDLCRSIALGPDVCGALPVRLANA